MATLVEQFKKSKEQAQVTGTPRKERTLAEVLSDKNNSHLFGRLLEKNGHDDLALRLAQGKLEQDDIALLEEQRQEFEKKVAKSEKIEAMLTEDGIQDVARYHPDFAKIINLVGPKKAIRAIQSQLKEICLTDESRFEEIARPIEAYESFRHGEFKKINDKVEKLCADNEISPEEYVSALAIKDPKEKEAALRQLSKKSFGKFRRAADFVFRGGLSDETFEKLKGSEAPLENVLQELEEYKQAIGEVLFGSVSANVDMRGALSRELVSENAPAEKQVGFNEARKGTFNEKEFGEAWEEFKKRMNFTGKSPADQDALKNTFLNEQKQKYRDDNADNGFWSHVFSTLFEEKIDRKKQELK